jgi:DNA repair exonuclease SbcCD ATPase subunit
MKFVPLKMSAKNFMSYDSMEFDFTKHSGVNLITGLNRDLPNGCANGSGKTGCPQILAFGLYGKPISSVTNSALVNMQNPLADTECTVEFLVGEKQYKTTWRVVKGQYVQCQIFEDGKDITPPGVVEARQLIEKEILGMNFKNSFLQTVILTKENCPSFFSLPTAQKRIFTETLFDLSVFGKMNELVRRGTLDIAKEIAVLQQEEMGYHKTLRQLREKEEAFVKESQIELDAIKVQISKLIAQLCEMLRVQSASEISEKKLKIEETRDLLIAKEKNLNSQHVKFAKLHSSSDTEIKQKTQFIKKYEAILNCLCEKCKDTIESEFGIDDAQAAIAQSKSDLLAAQQQEIEIKQNLVDTQHKLQKIKEKISDIDKLSNEIKLLKSKIQQSNSKISPYLDIIATNESKLAEVKDAIVKKHSLETYHNILQHMTSEDGIKKTIIENLVTILNSQIEYYLTRLGANYKCEFQSDFECAFTSNGIKREFNSFSAGEKARIDIATLFAFKDLLIDQTVMSSSVMFMDEFFDSSLDDYSVTAMLEILKEAAKKYGQTIYIISHRELIKNETFAPAFIDNTITIEKSGGISKIVKDAQGGIA